MASHLFAERPNTGYLIAQAIGITASTYLLGGNAHIGLVAIPAVMQAPSPIAARQWRTIFHIGHFYGIGCTVTATLATIYVAYHQDPASLSFKLNAAAALVLPSIIPFTLLAIAPTNDKLHEKARTLAIESKAEEVGAYAETTKGLIEKWAKLHLVRTAITGAGAVLAVWAALERTVPVSVGRFGVATGANRLG